MTALRPVETRDIQPGASTKYPTGDLCAVPGCQEPAGGDHHIVSRSKIKSDSYFVKIDGGPSIPHVVPLCGSGTTGHHGDVEEQRAWIKLEDGDFIWYEAVKDGTDPTWENRGSLDPQPGPAAATKPKRRKAAETKEESRARPNFTIKAPKGEDNVIPELVADGKIIVKELAEYDDDATDYATVAYALVKLVQDNRDALKRGRAKARRKAAKS